MGRGNQYTYLVKVLYCKLLATRKKLPTFPHRVLGLNYKSREVGKKCVTTAPPWSLYKVSLYIEDMIGYLKRVEFYEKLSTKG